MCTAICYKTKDSYFGRNLDLEYSYNETVTITPRNFVFNFRKTESIRKHYAMIGMAFVRGNYPLYYDATNECGLSMAGLNFPENAVYFEEREGVKNIAPFELIPFVLSQCVDADDAKKLIADINIVKIDFSDDLTITPLHWIISDKKKSIVVESVADGLRIYDNPVGVLTNNPTFDMQTFNLNNYMRLSTVEPENTFLDFLKPYSRGMGAMGLPGDLSSQSRFVRAVFTKTNSVSDEGEHESVNQFFHILASVEQQRGCVRLDERFEITVYSSCCNTDRGIYYYKTYDNSQITAVDIRKEKLDDDMLVSYPLVKKGSINFQN